jgi:hypothetical protein
MGEDLERGDAMPSADRRHLENLPLRGKIDHIQKVSEQLKTLVAQVQAQTVAWAREGKVDDLPNAELASHLSASFQQQRAALAEIQEDIKGVVTRMAAPALITDEELAALMK